MHRRRNNPFSDQVKHLQDARTLGLNLIRGSGAKKKLAQQLAKRHAVSVAYVHKAAQFAKAYRDDEFEDLIKPS